MQTRGKVKLVFIIYECTMSIKIWQPLLIPSHLCPGVPSRIHPPLPGIIPPISLTEEGETVLTNTMTTTVSHIVLRALWVIYERLLPKKHKSPSLEQRVSAAVRRCVCRTPASPTPEPQPRPSDVCVSLLMKKFWYLGETLLSAEQILAPPCPQPLHSHTAAPPNHNPIRLQGDFLWPGWSYFKN